MKLRVARKFRNRCMKSFRRLRILFFRERQRVSLRGLHAVHLQLPLSRLSEIEKQHLHGYIEQVLLAGFQLRVIPTQEQMSDGCIGMMSFLFEGRLIHRTELHLPQATVDAKQHAFRLIGLSIYLKF